MAKYTREDIVKLVNEENVKYIRLQFTDILGTIKNVEIPVSQLEKALDNKCMFDGSSIEGFVRIEESDMYLYPDLNTFVVFPWTAEKGKVARFICDIYNPDGTPFEGDPRNNLKRILKEMKELGFSDFNLGPEPEFFLFKLGARSKYPPLSFNSSVGSPFSSNLNRKNSGSGPRLKSLKPSSFISFRIRLRLLRGSPSNVRR